MWAKHSLRNRSSLEELGAARQLTALNVLGGGMAGSVYTVCAVWGAGPTAHTGGESRCVERGHTHRPVRVPSQRHRERFRLCVWLRYVSTCVCSPCVGGRATNFFARAQARESGHYYTRRTYAKARYYTSRHTVTHSEVRSRGAWPRQARSRLSGRRAVAGWPRSSAAARETSRVRVRA